MQLSREVVAASPSPGGGALETLRAVARALLALPRRWAWVPPVAWMGLIWFLSSRPVGPLEHPSPWRSFLWNLAHGPEYGVLTLLCLPLCPRAGGWVRLGRAQALAVATLVGAWAVLDELHQARVSGRASSAGDALTDLVSALAVLAVARYVMRADARERGLLWRLTLGAAIVLAVVALATFEHRIPFLP